MGAKDARERAPTRASSTYEGERHQPERTAPTKASRTYQGDDMQPQPGKKHAASLLDGERKRWKVT